MYIEGIKKFLNNHFYIQLANIFFVASGLLIHLHFSRGGLKFEDYGTFNVLLSVQLSLSLIFTSGFPLFAIRQTAKATVSINEFLALVAIDMLSCLCFIFAISVGTEKVSQFLFVDPKLTTYLPLVAWAVPSYLFYAFIAAYLNGNRRFKEQSFLLIIHSLVKLLSAVVLAYYWGINGGLMAYAVPGFFIGFLSLIKLSRTKDLNAKQITQHFTMNLRNRALWTFVLPATAYAFVNGAIISKDLLIVENLLSNADLSVYSVLVTVGRVPHFVLITLGSVFFPVYASCHTKKELRREFFRDLIIEVIIIFSAILAYFLLGGWVLGLLYGDTFTQQSNTLCVTAISGLIYSWRSLICIKLQATNHGIAALLGGVSSLIILEFVGEYAVRNYALMGAASNLLLSSLPVFILQVTYFYALRCR